MLGTVQDSNGILLLLSLGGWVGAARPIGSQGSRWRGGGIARGFFYILRQPRYCVHHLMDDAAEFFRLFFTPRHSRRPATHVKKAASLRSVWLYPSIQVQSPKIGKGNCLYDLQVFSRNGETLRPVLPSQMLYSSVVLWREIWRAVLDTSTAPGKRAAGVN